MKKTTFITNLILYSVNYNKQALHTFVPSNNLFVEILIKIFFNFI